MLSERGKEGHSLSHSGRAQASGWTSENPIPASEAWNQQFLTGPDKAAASHSHLSFVVPMGNFLPERGIPPPLKKIKKTNGGEWGGHGLAQAAWGQRIRYGDNFNGMCEFSSASCWWRNRWKASLEMPVWKPARILQVCLWPTLKETNPLMVVRMDS